jgi:hypothetical protein
MEIIIFFSDEFHEDVLALEEKLPNCWESKLTKKFILG